MKNLLLLLLLMPMIASAIETPDYEMVETITDEVEIRSYPDFMIARTRVDANAGDAGTMGFRRLAGFIFGDNASDQKIAMTAPVMQNAVDNRSDQHDVVFVMPADLTDIPTPDDQRVIIEQTSMTVAVLKYRGGWSQKSYEAHKAALEEALKSQDKWQIAGNPIWARYNSPMMPSFMRTNEVLIPVTRSN